LTSTKKGFVNFKDENMPYSDGWGETFWIKSGKVIAELKKYSVQNMDDLILNNANISVLY